jgi:ABC-type sugar transport system ATPase subunit
MKAIMAISQTVVVLAEGKKIAQGTPLEITRSQEVIEAYLGSRFAQRQRQLEAQEAEAESAARREAQH